MKTKMLSLIIIAIGNCDDNSRGDANRSRIIKAAIKDVSGYIDMSQVDIKAVCIPMGIEVNDWLENDDWIALDWFSLKDEGQRIQLFIELRRRRRVLTKIKRI